MRVRQSYVERPLRQAGLWRDPRTLLPLELASEPVRLAASIHEIGICKQGDVESASQAFGIGTSICAGCRVISWPPPCPKTGLFSEFSG